MIRHTRRALLYTPGDDQHKIQKAASLDIDCICMDMEDGVAQSKKPEARSNIREALLSMDFGRSERLVRINPVHSGYAQLDITHTIPSKPDGVVIPKVETGEEIRWVSSQISEIEKYYKLPIGEIGIIAIVESARGIINLPQISSADDRLQALIFGSEDLAVDIGAVRSQNGREIFYARSAIVLHAAAYHLQAIDQVYINFQDTEGLIKDSHEGMRMGYSGKQIIHPNQILPVQQAFTPSDQEIADALRMTAAFKESEQNGFGAFAIDGKMIDAPIIKSAQQILDRARAAGKL